MRSRLARIERDAIARIDEIEQGQIEGLKNAFSPVQGLAVPPEFPDKLQLSRDCPFAIFDATLRFS